MFVLWNKLKYETSRSLNSLICRLYLISVELFVVFQLKHWIDFPNADF